LFSLRRKHEVSDEELSALIDGQLAPDVAARVERHAATCAACAEKLSDLRSLRSTLSELPRATAPRSFALREADVRAAAAVTSDRRHGCRLHRVRRAGGRRCVAVHAQPQQQR
jgi:anti-sigma factor RsiW